MLHSVTNVPRAYAWGSVDLLAALEQREPTGDPEAEVWFGDHPADPSDLGGGGTLAEITGGRLPFLLKLLAAGSPLSIQVHPTRAQAQEGFAREAHLAPDASERNYVDDNHKPELIVALSDRFEALCGLRTLDASLRLLKALGEGDAVEHLRALLRGERAVEGEPPLRGALRWLLSEATAAEVAAIIDAVNRCDLSDLTAADAADIAAIRVIAERYPGDPGVVVALLMNRVVLSRGEGMFLGAGVVHAYLSGLGVEIMAASDNVLRGGLTPKRIDVPELLSIVDPHPFTPHVQPVQPGAVQVYSVPVSDFALRRVELDGVPHRVQLVSPAIVLATAGDVHISASDGEVRPVPVGSAVYVEDEAEVVLGGAGEVFVAEGGA